MLFKLNTFAIMAICLNSVIAAPLPADSATQVAATAGVSKEVREATAANNLADAKAYAKADIAYDYDQDRQSKK
jgi:hypothetical protein